MKYAKNVTDLIGNTPLLRLKHVSDSTQTTVLGKCEFLNPSHSVKDRIGFHMIKEAFKRGDINKESHIIEPTSGNTGIGLAMVCASFGITLTLTMPSSMSMERRKLLSALGANLILTEPALGMRGAVEKALELAEQTPNSYVPQQFSNMDNPAAHRKTTALEILKDTNGGVDIFIAAVGTGGTITGIGEVLKQYNPNIQIIAVEPDLSPVLSGGQAGPHKIQGIGAGFIPDALNTKIYDEVLRVSYEDARDMSRELANKEGLIVGISTGCNVFAAKEIASREENQGKVIVTILCDTGERYLSSGLYDE
ncbi:MAG: cysteine synthase A [Sulfurimonas sp.]|jgi:cysteine synthase A